MHDSQFDRQLAEFARTERWNQSLSERFAGLTDSAIQVRFTHADLMTVTINEVCTDWMRGTLAGGSLICIPYLHVVSISGTATGAPARAVDPVAPSFRSTLSELSRRRQLVSIQVAGEQVQARIHHVGRDYVETDGEVVAVVPISSIEFVIVTSLASPQ